jgi:hypothetical protein
MFELFRMLRGGSQRKQRRQTRRQRRIPVVQRQVSDGGVLNTIMGYVPEVEGAAKAIGTMNPKVDVNMSIDPATMDKLKVMGMSFAVVHILGAIISRPK